MSDIARMALGIGSTKWRLTPEQAAEAERGHREMMALSAHFQRMAMQPGATKTENGVTYVLNRNHRWTLPEKPTTGTGTQKGMFGEDYSGGRYDESEHANLTGDTGTRTPQRKTEHQDSLFDMGKKSDAPGQNLLFG